MSEERNNPREVKAAASENPGQPSQRRRRLVKGALSAPVFLTLQNGSVFANTSNDAEIAQTLDDAGNDPVCVFPVSNLVRDGEKFDFGETPPLCFGERGTEIGQFTIDDSGSSLRCNVNGDPNFQGGYIVAGSSGASIC